MPSFNIEFPGYVLPYVGMAAILAIFNGFVSSKIYDIRDDFDFDIVNFPFLDGDVPRRPSYGVYISLSSYDLLE